MELSDLARNALNRVQRYDSINYANNVEKHCKEVVVEEMRRLEKIKNGTKEIRSKTFDNELTMVVLNNQLRLITDLNKEMTELKKVKELYDKDQLRKKEQ